MMKKLLFFLRLCLYFLIGNNLFNLVCSITEITVVNNLGMHVNFGESYIKSFTNNLCIYTIIYFTICIFICMYDMFSVKILNEKLEKVKRGNQYEK